MMLAHKGVPADVIYRVMRKTFANIAKWTAVHEAARTTKPEKIKDLSRMPIHTGAMRYYKEMGILK